MLMACLVSANAQDFNQKRIETPIQSQQIMMTGATYSGTVYEPFSTTTPAEQSYTPAKAPGGPRRTESSGGAWGDNKQDENQDESFPLGDAVLPMLAFALMFCGYVAVRRKRAVNG